MGAMKQKFAEYKKKRSEKVEKKEDPLGDLLGMVRAYVEEHRMQFPTDPPPVITMGPFREAVYVTVSDKAYRRSVSGWGDTYGEALEKLEGILARDEIPWKSWDEK